MFAKILGWLLKLVDIDVGLDGDILHIKITLGKITVLDIKIDLIKDKVEKGTGDIRSARVNMRSVK